MAPDALYGTDLVNLLQNNIVVSTGLTMTSPYCEIRNPEFQKSIGLFIRGLLLVKKIILVSVCSNGTIDLVDNSCQPLQVKHCA